MRRTEMRSRTSLASAEPRLDVSDLGQLLGRELALQSIDGLCQIFSMMPAPVVHSANVELLIIAAALLGHISRVQHIPVDPRH